MLLESGKTKTRIANNTINGPTNADVSKPSNTIEECAAWGHDPLRNTIKHKLVTPQNTYHALQCNYDDDDDQDDNIDSDTTTTSIAQHHTTRPRQQTTVAYLGGKDGDNHSNVDTMMFTKHNPNQRQRKKGKMSACMWTGLQNSIRERGQERRGGEDQRAGAMLLV